MGPNALRRALRDARVTGGRWNEKANVFELEVKFARGVPGSPLIGEHLLALEGVRAIALGWDAQRSLLPARANMRCLSPWPFAPQTPRVVLSRRPVGREIRAVHGGLRGTQTAPVAVAFSFERAGDGRRLWLQVWADRAAFYGAEDTQRTDWRELLEEERWPTVIDTPAYCPPPARVEG